MTTATTTRNADLADLAAILKTQQAQKIDVVAPAAKLRSVNGQIVVAGAEHQLTEDGVTVVDGTYRPTDHFDAQLAERLEIPIRYLRRMRAEAPDLFDANVNGWLHGSDARPGDGRSFLFRGFRSQDGTGIGIGRSLSSDRFGGVTEDLDALVATMAGIHESGVPIEVISCDLTDRRMYVRIAAPAVAALAPTLLAGYRRPWGPGQAPWETQAGRDHGWLTPDEQPVVFAGFTVSNSEVGAGAFTITPEIIVKVCRNGLTIKADQLRAVHIGGKLETGIVRWSEDTQRKQLAVITAKARDAVATFLDVEYVQAKVAEIEKVAGVEVSNPQATIEHVAKKLAFTEDVMAGVLGHFIRGGQVTAGGVLQAVTSYAQEVRDADAAYELQGKGIEAMHLAAAAAA